MHAPIVLVGLIEPSILITLPVEDFDDLVPLDGFLRDPGHIAHRVLYAAAVSAKDDAQVSHDQCDDRRDHEYERGELRTEIDHECDEPQDRKCVADRDCRNIVGGFGDLLDIER